MPHHIALLALPDCIGLSVYGPADLFHTANAIAKREGNRTDLFHTHLISPDGKDVTSFSGHKISVEGKLADIRSPSVIMIPGIGLSSEKGIIKSIGDMSDVAKALSKYKGKKTVLTAVCTGTMLLAETGLLDNHKATTTWWIEEIYKKNYPQINLQTDEILVDDGPVVTSAAGASSLDLTLHIINRLAGAQLSRLCARFLVIDNSRHLQRPYIVPWHSKFRDELIEKADAWIRKNILNSCRVEDLSSHLGVSSRTLLRRFQTHLNQTPQTYIQTIKMDHAKMQLETTDITIASLGLELGFSDENAFRRAFSLTTGLSPAQYRRQFKLG